jgi:hypothetical protein
MDTWDRTSIYDEPALTPNSGAELCARSSIQNSDLTEAQAPPLVSQNFEPTHENSQRPENNVDRLKHNVSSTTPNAEVSTPPTTSSKTVWSIGSRTVVIFGMLSFAAGVGLGAIVVSKLGWNLHARPSYESIAAANLASAKTTPVAAQTTPVAASAPDSDLSEIANQLKSVGTELTSLREDVRSLAGEVAQIREAQSISKVRRRDRK